MMPEFTALSRVIGEVYDAALDAALWSQALQATCQFIGGHEARMYWHGASDGVDTLHEYNCDPHFTSLYEERYISLNPLFPAFFFQDVGAVVSASDVVPNSEMYQSRFYKEWMAPQGLRDALGTILQKEKTSAAFLTVQWRDDTLDAEARRRMALLVPHFQRAASIGRLLVKRRLIEAGLTETLDHVDEGVFLVDVDCRIVFANAIARKLIEDRALLHVSNGLLRATAVEADRMMGASFRATGCHDNMIGPRGLTVTLSDGPHGRWTANVLPLGDGVRRRVGDAHSAIAAVFVRNATFADPTPLETLAKQFGLTASEIRVVEAMLRVSGIKAIAGILGISDATVKTHLNRIYRKCGARNQSDLIKLVAGIGR